MSESLEKARARKQCKWELFYALDSPPGLLSNVPTSLLLGAHDGARQHTKDSGVPCYGVTQKVSQHHAAAAPDAPRLLRTPLSGVQPGAQFSADPFLTIRSRQLLIWSRSQAVITLLISIPSVSFWTTAFSYDSNVC